mmetsp:Transcript_105172/g.201928  ORF Transcript_105172/g.201928 Transcript_105172/m.201928 type:complete len:98 (+) Transcript_105172:80-373(+)
MSFPAGLLAAVSGETGLEMNIATLQTCNPHHHVCMSPCLKIRSPWNSYVKWNPWNGDVPQNLVNLETVVPRDARLQGQAALEALPLYAWVFLCKIHQ